MKPYSQSDLYSLANSQNITTHQKQLIADYLALITKLLGNKLFLDEKMSKKAIHSAYLYFTQAISQEDYLREMQLVAEEYTREASDLLTTSASLFAGGLILLGLIFVNLICLPLLPVPALLATLSITILGLGLIAGSCLTFKKTLDKRQAVQDEETISNMALRFFDAPSVNTPAASMETLTELSITAQ